MPDLLELYHERCAIMQYDAGLPRAEAEKRAYFDLKKRYGLRDVPEEIREIVRKATREVGKNG